MISQAMTVPKSEFSDSFPHNARQAQLLDGQVLGGLRQGPRTIKDLSSSLQREQALVKATLQSLVKMRLCEEVQGGKGGPRKYRLSKQAGARAGLAEPAAAGADPRLPPPPSGYMHGGPMLGYAYPHYGQQMYFYMPLPYQAAAGGKQLGGSGGADLGAQPVPHMVPYPFPPTPYSSPLRLPSNPQPPPRRPVSNGWGGMPLGSQASNPAAFPPPHLHMASSPYRGIAPGPRGTGAARTVPLPPKRASSADGSTAAPPTPQADRLARSAASLSSSASSDGEGGLACHSGSGEVLPAAMIGQDQQQAAAAAAQEGSHGGPVPAAKATEGSSDGSRAQGEQGAGAAGSGSSGHQAPATADQRGGHRGSSERQPCAFFLKTGTCAYGDRCKFEHPYELAPHVEFNSLGLPLRPSEPECSYYMKYKTCGFGHTCKFHHPELSDGELAVAAGGAVGSHQTPFTAMQYMAFGGGFPLAYAYPGGPIQSPMGPSFIPPPPGAVYPSASTSQPMVPPPPQPFAPHELPPHPAQAQAPKQPARSTAAEPAENNLQAVPAVAVPAVPVPIPLASAPASAPDAPQQAQQDGSASGATAVSPPRPLMVFGKSKAASE